MRDGQDVSLGEGKGAGNELGNFVEADGENFGVRRRQGMGRSGKKREKTAQRQDRATKGTLKERILAIALGSE